MDPWWMYALVFLFGYVTCQTFYFVRASRISLSLLNYCQIIYLSSMIKIIDNLLQIKHLNGDMSDSSEKSDSTCTQISEKIDTEISILKNNSINYLINMHPRFYRDSLKFEDWDSSMKFIQDKKEEAFNFWNHDGN